jgi:alcohol dehydrogenase
MERAYTHGDDHGARIGMAYASIYAGLSYGSAGLNAVHGIAYAVAGITHRSHGSTNAVMLPYVLDALREVRRAELLEVFAMLTQQPFSGAIVAASDEDKLRDVPRLVRDMVGRLGIPTDLRAFGIAEADIPALTRDALGVTRLAKALPVANVAAAYGEIVRKAWAGRLWGDA